MTTATRAIRNSLFLSVVITWMLLCLSLLEGTAQASAVSRPEDMPLAMAAMPLDSMPMALDWAPCVRCYVAPVPVAQGFIGESKEAQAPHWQIHAISKVEAARAFDSGVWHPRLPVRIEFSRWLN